MNLCFFRKESAKYVVSRFSPNLKGLFFQFTYFESDKRTVLKLGILAISGIAHGLVNRIFSKNGRFGIEHSIKIPCFTL